MSKLKLFSFWLLQSSVWVEQEPLESLNRKTCCEGIRSSKQHREGTWKLRLA